MVDLPKIHRQKTHKYPKGHLKVCVIGGNGFIGRHLITHLATRFKNLLIYSIDAQPHSIYINKEGFNSIVREITMDVSIPEAIRPWLYGNQPDIIIYAAGHETPANGLGTISEDMNSLLGLTNIVETIAYVERHRNKFLPITDEIKSNLALTRLLNVLPEIKPDFFLYFSSASVYGDYGRRGITEESKLKPLNHVGQARVLAEHAIELMFKPLDIPYAVVRPTEVYGTHSPRALADPRYWPGFISYFTDKYIKAIEYKARYEGKKDVPNLPYDFGLRFSQNTTLDFVHVDYVCKVVTEICRHKIEGTYNLASGQYNKLTDLLTYIEGGMENLIDGIPKLRIDKKNNITKLPHCLVKPGFCEELIPYDSDKYKLSRFVEENCAKRLVEIKTRMDYEEAIARGHVIDTTGRNRGTELQRTEPKPPIDFLLPEGE